MGVIASQLIGKVSIEGAGQSQKTLLDMDAANKKAQDSLNKLQGIAKDVGSILSNRLASDIKTAQGGLQDLGSRAQSAGLDISKFTTLQQKSSEAAAKLGLAQAQAADATAKANAITNDASASAEKIALAQARATVAAENVRKAELAAGDAMTMVTGEATRLADALEMTQAKGSIFSSVLGGMKQGASGFFGAIADAPGKLAEATQKIGFFIFGAQQIVQTGEQMASAFIGLGKSAGDFQSGITSLSTGAGELDKNLGMVSDGILKLAPEVGESTKELEAGMFTIESSGQHGADALLVLKNAAEGAKVGTADLADVANGVTTALNDYGLSAKDSASVTNDLIATVGAGKTTMGELASSLKDVLPIASNAGVSLNGVTAALATMTGEGVPASQAANYLKGAILALEAPSSTGAKTLASIGLSAQKVASEMKDSLPGALQLITEHLKTKFPEGSAAYTAALKDITGGSEALSAVIDLTGDHMKTFEGNVDNIYQAVKKGGTGIAGWAKVQQDFNFQLDRAKEGLEVMSIKLGTRLFPVFSQTFGWVSDTAIPTLGRFSDWFFDKGVPALEHFVAPLQNVGHWFQDFVGHGQSAIPILAGIAAVIATLLVPAVWSLASGVVTATWPFLLIAVAVGGLTAVFLHFYNSNAGFRDFINGIGDSLKNLWNILVSNVSPIMHQIGDFISSTFAPVWEQLQDVWKSQLQPALASLTDSFKRLQPVLQVVGEIIGGILLADIGFLVGIVGGLVGALAGMTKGIAEIFGGIVQGMSGFIQVISGIVQFIIDLFTGHFDKLKGDINTILGGIGQVFTGFGATLKGIIDTIVGGVTGGFKGMTTSVVGYLNDLVHGVDDKTQKASIAAQLHTAEMRDKSIANAQKTNEGMQTHYQNMRVEIENQLIQTTDATQKHTLEMKLVAVNNALQMSQEAGQKFVDMRTKSQEQIDLLKQGIDTSMMSAADKAKYHSLNMKDMYLQGVIAMDNDSIKKVDHMRQGILEELSRTTDGAKKQSLETQLTQVTHAEDTAKQVKDQHVKMRQDTENEMDKLKKSVSDKSSSIMKDITGFFGGIGKWFSDRWVDVQGAFGNTGQWFHDRWNEAWAATTGVFGKIGGWFTDRWHDTQSVFANIGGWFHDRGKEAWDGITSFFATIGKWFSDRWSDIMASTKPFRDYMGAVFETIGRIVHAIFDKIGAWFHDRFAEAYNKIVEVFGPIGKWFQDRWTDTQNVFKGVGQWFHDRFMEAIGAVYLAFQFMGKWFGDRWVDTQNVFKGVGQWFHDRFAEAWSGIVSFFGPIGKWFQDRWTDTQNAFKSVGGWFHDRFSEAWAGITAFFAPIGKWFSDRWSDVMGGVNTFKTAIENKFNEVKTGVTNIFHDMINGIVDKLNSGISAVESFINFFGQGLDSVAVSLGTKGTIPVAHLGRIPHYAAGTDSHPGGPAIVGEKGPELAFLPAGTTVVPHDLTSMLLSMFGGKIPGYASGVGDIAGSIAGWISGGAKSLLDNVIGALHIQSPNLGPMSNIAGGIFDTVKNWALSWVSGILPKFSFGAQAINVPGNLASWIAQAMALTGVPASWSNPLAQIALHESGGNPAAINLWDSNAKAGHPSQGLFQTIPSTFAAHMLPGHANILNPIDNAASAIGYIKGRYGDVFHVPGIVAMSHGGAYVGYANGGIINEPIVGKGLKTGTNYAFGERGKELVTPYVPSGVNLASQSSPTINITVNVQPNDFNVDGRKLARALMPHHVELVRQTSGVKI